MTDPAGPPDLDLLLANLPDLPMPPDVAADLDAALTRQDEARVAPPAPGNPVTFLPQASGQPRRGRVRLAVGSLVAVAAAIVVALTITGGHDSRSPAGSAAASGIAVARTGAPVYASSGRALSDDAAVRADVSDLLAKKLPAANEVQGNLSAPNAASKATAGAAAGAAVAATRLGPDLSLTDPALPTCLSALADGATLLGVDRATYAGQLSLIVVTEDTVDAAAHEAEAFIVGPDCSVPGPSGLRRVVVIPLP